ncbi:LysM peptidoglycan-binding domain-containing protein [Clostridium estertheticum]|nr:LysM peptidoglycan-binding domain-containing protein [Clostridium estertheticum]
MKLNLKTTLLALTLALVSSSSVYAASYTVKSGDTLYSVSKAYNTTTNILMKDNGLSNSTIYSGQILDVTKGALYFFDDSVTNEWLTSKTVATSVGNLTFAY